MKVKDLIEDLKKFDPELNVILSNDSEGINFSHLDNVSNNYAFALDPIYGGKIYELNQMGYKDNNDDEQVVVLFPYN
jgi:hypothetical protein